MQCTCPKDAKIPIKELHYIYCQRQKVGTISSFQIGRADISEHKRLQRKEHRRQEELEREKRQVYREKRPVLETPMDFEDSSSEANSSVESECEQIQLQSSPAPKRNTEDISNIALAAIRYGVGLRATAAIATAAWIDAGIITKNETRLAIDHNKVRRTHKKLKQSAIQKFKALTPSSKIECIMFDSRLDMTRTLRSVEGSKKQYPELVKEEHYTVCSEPGGKYLFHFTPTKPTDGRKHAEVVANYIFHTLSEHGIDKTFMAIGCDSTIVNTGSAGGVMHYLEVKLQRKVNWLVCALHTNKLPLKHLITALDGKTISGNKWTGPIGKLLNSATDLTINPTFPTIIVGDPPTPLTPGVIEDLSADQYYAYNIVQAIRSGNLPGDLAVLEIGPVNHARWLTTANRICRLWVSQHHLKGSVHQNLRMVVEFIVGVYVPTWFMIKVKHNWTEGPRHLSYQLKQLKTQCKAVDGRTRTTLHM